MTLSSAIFPQERTLVNISLGLKILVQQWVE